MRGIWIWVSTVVTFAVWYWEIDGGGPDERARETHASEDFLFPQITQQDGKEAIGWAPDFLDYLFVCPLPRAQLSDQPTRPYCLEEARS